MQLSYGWLFSLLLITEHRHVWTITRLEARELRTVCFRRYGTWHVAIMRLQVARSSHGRRTATQLDMRNTKQHHGEHLQPPCTQRLLG
jgi:hypothetical protein